MAELDFIPGSLPEWSVLQRLERPNIEKEGWGREARGNQNTKVMFQ